ncbi:hypothetical protein [Paenibacillus prosopidis]|uniref:Peptidase YpeB-like protein n=1 Tax=Paenibacillus prosopidis TaxID=630520 RepID=A0A368W8C5_9BACL|nr:hypothetical protein [Paenibacillus prosopidis]RCW51991.1 hypothetical protein DFP97_101337 [Paenibacillus prosopidis]
MRKKITATVLTVGAAFALITGNGIMTTYAASNADAQKVEVIGKHQQPAIAQIEDAPVNLKEAVVIAEKAIQEKFKVPLNGFKISYDLGTRVDMEGTFYFVTFSDSEMDKLSDDEIIEAKRKVKSGKDHGYKSDIYTAFINSKTGEIVSVERNPTAPEGVN